MRTKTLSINRETIRVLQGPELARVAGGLPPKFYPLPGQPYTGQPPVVQPPIVTGASCSCPPSLGGAQQIGGAGISLGTNDWGGGSYG